MLIRIERKDNEILISVAAGTDLIGLQRIMDYLKFRELTSTSKATQKQLDKLAVKSKSAWWKKNESQFRK